MRIKLFWQLLATFAILIAFGVGGTVAIILVFFTQISDDARPDTASVTRMVWSTHLEEYYRKHGDSWEGVDSWLHDWRGPGNWDFGTPPDFTLLDQAGQVVAEANPQSPDPARGIRRADQIPLTVDGRHVGTLQVPAESLAAVAPPAPWLNPSSEDGRAMRFGPNNIPELVQPAIQREFQHRIGRSFMLVALAIGSMTLGLSVIMSRRIAAPLAHLTHAAGKVAGGDLHVAVRGSSVQEVDRLARAFNTMAENLRHEDQLRRNMTADIAHELRTPLTIIKGKLEGILDGVYPPTDTHVTPVLEEVVLLERLVEDLRLLSLAEARQLPLHVEQVNVADLLEDTYRSFVREARAQEVQLSVEVAEDTASITVDPQRMQQIFGNLVANSLRHTPAGGRIELRAERRSDGVTIMVRDTGRGIAAADLPHIFDRFWRGDKARSRQGSGAGLGLAIARQLVEAQGGRIEASSTLGHGTTFRIDLPGGG